MIGAELSKAWKGKAPSIVKACQEDVSADMRVAMFSGRFGRSMSAGMARMISSMIRSRGGMRRGPGGGMPQPVNTGPAWDTLVVQMQKNSLAQMDREAEPELYRSILKAKSLTIYRVIKSVLGADKFIDAIAAFAEEHKYQQISFADFKQREERTTSDPRPGGRMILPSTSSSSSSGSDSSSLSDGEDDSSSSSEELVDLGKLRAGAGSGMSAMRLGESPIRALRGLR